jgi:hypothetical protein
VSHKRQELLALREKLGPPPVFTGVSVVHRFSFLCCAFFLLVFGLCLVCPVLSVSLDCPFFIACSVFSNIYCFVFLSNKTVDILFSPDNGLLD